MAYNRENLLRKMIEVRDIVLVHQKKGVPQTEIFRRYIKNHYHISYSTFNNWLATPAHAQLERLRERKERAAAIKRQQTTIWED